MIGHLMQAIALLNARTAMRLDGHAEFAEALLHANNCGNTKALFNDNAKIYLALYQTIHENGRLETFSIGR